MSNVFYISDTHFGHESTCTKFTNKDGSPLRPFSCAQEMDEEMIRRWNSVVGKNDKVYHLGDVCINKRYLSTMERLNGSKTLIRGNHDIFKIREYLKYFSEVHAVRYTTGRDFVMSHIPLHPECIAERYRVNVHGHLHANLIGDPRYINVSVEQINFTPLAHEDLVKIITDRKEPIDEWNDRTRRTVAEAPRWSPTT